MAALRRRLPVVVVLGSTGTGKSRLAIELGKLFSGEIISADSMQVYKGLDIITNKVTAKEKSDCPHHLIDFVSPLNTKYTVVDFQSACVPLIDRLILDHKLPIIVGGTNYYIEALLWNFLIKQDKEKPDSSDGGNTGPNLPKMIHLSAATGTDDDKHPSTSTQDDKTNKESTFCKCAKDPACKIPDNPTQQSQVKRLNLKRNRANSNEEGDYGDGSSLNIYTEENLGSSDSETDSNQLTDVREWGYQVEAHQLHSRLKQVDPVTAKRIHPNDRRKLIRALEIYNKHGVPMSEILSEQHQAVGSGAMSGPLRYPVSCIFWVQCDQEVLKKRLDDRVDDMIERGLTKELLEFHKQYNETRILEGREPDYSWGIFQSIGFKEFHDYLILSEEERTTTAGKRLFNESVEALKRVTRKYAKKQVRWLKNRLLKRPADNTPPVYALDTTDPSQWETLVRLPASNVVEAMLKGETPVTPTIPMEVENTKNKHIYNICDVCDGIILMTEKDYEMHMKSRKHKKNLCRKKKKASEGVTNGEKQMKTNEAPTKEIPDIPTD